ncbi:MAG: ROK family protein [Lachnospiraceae bacterium]|jgi:fructokinase|nr:ROK family protein [Lachnospiraceae bacterium]MEE3461035.1 ROK family protein [Lachnospiraceae bacterium]
MLIGALEAGGTKMVTALAEVSDEKGFMEKAEKMFMAGSHEYFIGEKSGVRLIDRAEIPTTDPDETIGRIGDYFEEKGMKDILAVGIASFGPLELDKESPKYGYITTTPKPGWGDTDLLGRLKKRFEDNGVHIPFGFDTDVNGSVLGEASFGCAKGLTDVVYITVGTGIGGGVISGGRLVHGMLHPELGHMRLTKKPEDMYECRCPFHKSCLEGLASGPAIEERWGLKAYDLADRAEVWELEGDYLAQALASLILTLSPQKIILGGGVMKQRQLFPLIRRNVQEELAGYIKTDEIMSGIDDYIVPESLYGHQGILGCVRLALDALS